MTKQVINGDTATLTSRGDITLFSYGDTTIRFRTSNRLDRYLSVKEWDKGYIVVSALYEGVGEQEEYIDLLPILHNLYIDDEKFLSHINKVNICYD